MALIRVFGPGRIKGTTKVRTSIKFAELAEDYNQCILFAVVEDSAGT